VGCDRCEQLANVLARMTKSQPNLPLQPTSGAASAKYFATIGNAARG
jgi:hypothetical protein